MDHALLVVSLILALLAAYPPANTRVGLLPLAFAFFIASYLFHI